LTKSRNPSTSYTTTKSGSKLRRQKSTKRSTTGLVTKALKFKRDRGKGQRVTRKPATILAPTSNPTTLLITTSIDTEIEAIREEVGEATTVVEAVVVVEAPVVEGALINQAISQL
jgi:hypothetical protein